MASIVSSPDRRYLARVSEETKIRLLEVDSGRLLRELEGHTSKVTSLCFSPDGRLLASASNDKTVRLWEVPSGRLLRIMKGHTRGVISIDFSPDGRYLASGTRNGEVLLWEVATGQWVAGLIFYYLSGSEEHFYSPESEEHFAVFTPDGRYDVSDKEVENYVTILSSQGEVNGRKYWVYRRNTNRRVKDLWKKLGIKIEVQKKK